MSPYYTTKKYQRHGRHSHHAVVYIAHIVQTLRNNFETEQTSTSEKLADSSYQHKNERIT